MLTRCPPALEGVEPDVLVVGGGIHGAWAALEATLRGLDVALAERDDFGDGGSANSLKNPHGGFRHVATARLDRARRSAVAQATLSGFAPELVRSCPACYRPGVDSVGVVRDSGSPSKLSGTLSPATDTR